MGEPKTSRPFQQRFLEGYDRSELRRAVRRVPPTGMAGMRRKYATWALGASLALGGIGAPLTMVQQNRHNTGAPEKSTVRTVGKTDITVDPELSSDLATARKIAQQVAGGVSAVAHGAAAGVDQAVGAPIETIASGPKESLTEAPKQMTVVTESVKEQFFKKEVPFGSIIYKEAKKNNIKPELVAAVVKAESRFKPTARSGAGAVGLMQLVPRTGRWMGARDLTNPAQNIAAGAKYLKYLNERFDGNETKVIAAYNAGEGNVRRFRGVPPFKETRNYVRKVRNYEKEFASAALGQIPDFNVVGENR